MNDEVLSQVYQQAANEMASQGYVSETVAQDFKERAIDALLVTLKTGSEGGFGTIVKNMGEEYQASLLTMLNDPKQRGNIGVKAVTGYLNLVITFGFNMALTDGVTHGEHLANAGKATANDLVFSAVLNRVAGCAAGPIGWTWTALDIIDTLAYDQAQADRLFKDGIDSIKEAQKSSSWWEGMMRHQYARDQLEAAREMQAAHHLIKAPSRGFSAFWDAISGSSSESPQPQAAPVCSSSPKPAQTGHSFFQSDKMIETKEPDHTLTIQFN